MPDLPATDIPTTNLPVTDLSGKVALITGASAPAGIGRAAALALSAAGARVVVTDIPGPSSGEGSVPEGTQAPQQTQDRMTLLNALVDDIKTAGKEALALACDVTQAGEITAALAETRRHFGGLDILVNNAGTTLGTGPFLEATAQQWEMSYRVNLAGPMLLCQGAIPEMRARGGGAIINVGSTGSLGAEAGFGAYTAMKHGLVGLSKTIAAEFGVDGIRCNVVCPGYVMTDMHMGANARIAREQGRPVPEVMAERYAGVALRRAGSPEEVAAVIAFLASPAATYITGAAIPISGGTPVGL